MFGAYSDCAFAREPLRCAFAYAYARLVGYQHTHGHAASEKRRCTSNLTASVIAPRSRPSSRIVTAHRLLDSARNGANTHAANRRGLVNSKANPSSVSHTPPVATPIHTPTSNARTFLLRARFLKMGG